MSELYEHIHTFISYYYKLINVPNNEIFIILYFTDMYIIPSLRERESKNNHEIKTKQDKTRRRSLECMHISAKYGVT